METNGDVPLLKAFLQVLASRTGGGRLVPEELARVAGGRRRQVLALLHRRLARRRLGRAGEIIG